MILDTNWLFEAAAGIAITTSKGSSYTVNLGAISDAAKGEPVYLNVILTQAATSSANQLTILLCSSSGATPGASDKFMEILKATAESALTPAGKVLRRMALPEGIPYETLGLYYVATTALDTPMVAAFFTIGSGEAGP